MPTAPSSSATCRCGRPPILKDGDTIRIDTGQVLRCNFTERIIEEERNIISSLEVRDVTHRFRKNDTGLDGISFQVSRGEMVCVMGASGSGKSTLLRAMSGQLQPSAGRDPAQRPVALCRCRASQAFRQLHPAGRRLRRSSHDRGEHELRRGHPFAASLPAGPRAAHRGQAHGTRPDRAARQHRRQRGQEDALRRRAQAAEHRPRHGFERGRVISSTSRPAA